MNQPDSYGADRRPSRPAQGVPIAIAVLGATGTFVLGLFFGRTSTVQTPQPGETVMANESAPGATVFDPRTAAQLDECKAEKKDMLAALVDVGEEPKKRSSGSSSRSSPGGTSSAGTSIGWRSEAESEDRRSADVRPWQARVQLLGNGPDLRVFGKIHNRESGLVEGLLHVALVDQEGSTADETSIPMMLEPGLTSWEYVFRWAPDDKYRAELEWETMTY